MLNVPDRLRSGVGARWGVRRLVSGGLVAAVALPAVVLLGRADGLPRSRVQLSGGAAWLASPTQGLLTLIDGASDQVVGAVRAPGARPGDRIGAVQQGSSAYVVNSARGTVSRVDGGTYETSVPVRFGAGGPNASLQVYPGAVGSYVVDGQRRVASVVDSESLRVRERLALTAQPGPGQSVVDGSGRLWVVDASGLAWFDGSGQHVRPELGGAQARLVLVDGQPVLVDLAHARVGRLTAGGEVASWSCLQLPAGEQPALLGSTTLGGVLAAIPSTGTLVFSGTGNDGCGLTVDIGRPGDDFGPLVEVSGFVFVPNRSLGRTTIVDSSARRVVADLDVVRPGGALELLAKDGLVFYNDLGSDRAGVIRLDGGQWRPGKALRKYDPARTGNGILTPSGKPAPKDKQANQPDQPGPGRPDQPQPSPGQPDPGQPDPGQPNPGQPDPGQPVTPSPSDPGAGPTPPPPVHPPIIHSLTWNPDTVVREQPATFSATVDNTGGATWHWSIIDPATGATLQEAASPDSATFTLPTSTPTNLEIRLEVSNTAGAATPVTKPFTTTSSLHPQIDSLTATPNPAGISQPVTFSAVETVAGSRGTWVWTVSGPGGTRVLPQVEPGKDLVLPFDTAGTYTMTLSVTYDGATDSHPVSVTVTDTASLTAITGSPVDLRSGGSAAVQVRLTNSFVAQTVKVSADGWLSLSDTAVPVQPGGTASVTVQLTGTPPADGVNANVVKFELTNGSAVDYDVVVDIPPQITAATCHADILNSIPVTHFTADVRDADPGTVTATVRVGGDSYPMRVQTLNGSGPGSVFFFFDRQRNLVPDVTEWTIVTTDAAGHVTTSQPQPRSTCW